MAVQTHQTRIRIPLGPKAWQSLGVRNVLGVTFVPALLLGEDVRLNAMDGEVQALRELPEAEYDVEAQHDPDGTPEAKRKAEAEEIRVLREDLAVALNAMRDFQKIQPAVRTPAQRATILDHHNTVLLALLPVVRRLAERMASGG